MAAAGVWDGLCTFAEAGFEFVFFYCLTSLLHITTVNDALVLIIVAQLLLFAFYLYIGPKYGESIAAARGAVATPFTRQHLAVCVVNFIISLAMAAVEWSYVLKQTQPYREAGEGVPLWLSWVVVVPVCVAADEVWFYYLHRLGHHPKLYKWCHKYHHTFQVRVDGRVLRRV